LIRSRRISCCCERLQG